MAHDAALQRGVVSVKVERKGETHYVNLDEYLTPKQQRAIAARPDMFWYLIQHLKQDLTAKGEGDYVGIYAISNVSLNGHPSKPLYDRSLDVSKAEWNRFSENLWVTMGE